MGNTSVYSYTGKGKGGKLLRLTVETESPITHDSLIKTIAIHGDFFAHPEDSFDTLEHSLTGKPVKALGTWFAKGIEQYNITVYGLLPEDLDTAIAEIVARGNNS